MWDCYCARACTTGRPWSSYAAMETPVAIGRYSWNGELSRNEGKKRRMATKRRQRFGSHIGLDVALNDIRGKQQPIFKWNSGTPWSEMQLSPSLPPDDATIGQVFAQAFPKVMWLIILFRVLGYCVKNYYLVNRHAVKRTTTFAGKHAAFSAALEATETLKRSKKSKN